MFTVIIVSRRLLDLWRYPSHCPRLFHTLHDCRNGRLHSRNRPSIHPQRRHLIRKMVRLPSPRWRRSRNLSPSTLPPLSPAANSQLPVIAVQAVVRLRDVPIATALVMFFQQLGGALFIAVGQSVFQNKLIPQMQQVDPSLSALDITMAGATGLKSLVPVSELPAVLVAYAKSLNATFQVAIAMAGLAAVMACGVEWVSVKGKKIDPMAAA